MDFKAKWTPMAMPPAWKLIPKSNDITYKIPTITVINGIT